MLKWGRFVMHAGTAAVLVLLHWTPAVGQSSAADPLVLRIEVLDELLSPVPDNTFLQGATVLVRGMLYSPAALDARAETDRAEVRVRAMEEGAADPQSLDKARATRLEARAELQELTARLENNRLIARGLEAAQAAIFVRAGDKSGQELAVATARRVTDETRLRVGSLAADALTGTLLWEVRTDELGTGSWRVQATSADFCPPGTADFDVIPLEAGTPEQQMILAYVDARVAAARGDTAEALRLAQEAISLGPPLHMNVMFSYRLLGDLYYDRGQRQAALEAYQQALAIAQEAFPKSDIPAILEPRIRELEQE